MNIKYSIFILALASSTMALAQGQRPDSAGQGRPEQNEMSQHAENMPMGDGDDHTQGMHRDEDHMEDMDEEGMEMGEGGRPENPGSMGEQKREENAQGPDLEKLQEKRGEDDRTEAGKGSEQGQASREENSRKWWRFWE